jgi:hypothetical protein
MSNMQQKVDYSKDLRRRSVVMQLFKRMTGGRPMTLVTPCFTDCVSGEEVGYYIDSLDRHWLATGKWAWFRVQPSHGPNIWLEQEKLQ